MKEKKKNSRKIRSRIMSLALVAAMAAASAGCSQTTSNRTQIDYWLWDANQLPSYAKCINGFEAENPDISVRITQIGWDDYWTKLTASFVAGTAPDVFTDHVGRYPQFMRRNVLQPLDEVDSVGKVKPSDFMPGLTSLWTGDDGHLYGMPKDYDTIALMYDQKKLEDAGVTTKELETATWNPDDGGSLEKILARLAIDDKGRRGDDPTFDPAHVKQHALGTDPYFDYAGQTNWSPFALSTGWRHTDKPTWGTRFQYDDPRFIKSIGWYTGLSRKGYMPKMGQFGKSVTSDQQLGSGKVAMSLTGSWMLQTYAHLKGIKLGIAPLPSGPSGHPVSLYNGLGDSISRSSKHKTEAGKLVSYLGSDACQVVMGQDAIVFPARPRGTEAAIEAFDEEGLDVTPFTDRVNRRETALYPIVDNAATVDSILQPSLDSVWMGTEKPSVFIKQNERVNKAIR